MVTINHQFYNKEFHKPQWHIKHLFLGTFNPSGGTEVNYYYGRERNRTWPLLRKIFDQPLDPSKTDEFFKIIEANGIACMDLITKLSFPLQQYNAIVGEGYKDSNIINTKVIRQYNTQNIVETINNNKGVKVYSTWGKGSKLKEWTSEVSEIERQSTIIRLVSPSMAARIPKGEKKWDYMLSDWMQKIIT